MPVSKKAYVINLDGKAVVNDGKQEGVILCGEGGTVSAEVAKKYGLSTSDDDPATVATTTPVPIVIADAAADLAKNTAPSS